MSVLLVSFWLTSGLFMMFLALLAYSSVLRVSCRDRNNIVSMKHKHKRYLTVTETTGRTSRLLDDGDTVAMMEVLVRPPRESCRILVSFDSLWEEFVSFIQLLIRAQKFNT